MLKRRHAHDPARRDPRPFGEPSSLPGAAIGSSVAVVVVFLFLVTSVDSAAYVLGMITSALVVALHRDRLPP